ncbi:aldo/keto reductase, partial [Streptomyces sp. NPDC005322]|uniref:aldo/keto reductase n=1 Tax=Streptomyces sp. NPDC005322 TaxID=3157032 RepID=UPI0033BD5B1F
MGFARLAENSTPAARIGLGLAAVGRPGYINLGRDQDLPAERTVDAMRQRSHELLDTAYANGVRYLDAARSYGRAEEFLADWLRQRPDARDAVVGSKWGYTYVADWRTDAETHEVKDHGVTTYERQRGLTDALLGDRLDLYQIHSVTPDSPALTDRALHERLARLAAEGVTVGISTSGPRQADAIRAALVVEVDGRPLFRTVQSTYNLLETSAGAALAEAHAAGRAVIVKEGVANGRLTAAAAEPPSALRRVAEETGATLDAVALAAVLDRPWVSVVLSGAATTDQLRSNLAAAELRLNERQSELLEDL